MNDEFKFPDEIEAAPADEEKLLIEIEDDTPPEDRNKEPIPEEVRQEIYADELEDYSTKVKKKLLQLKKLAHDERREKEAAAREQQEAIAFAQRVLEENRRLKSSLSESEKNVLTTVQQTVDLELANAKRAYREAYESADPDKILAAQEALMEAGMRADKVKNFRPPEPEPEVTYTPPAPRIQVDQSAKQWQERNTWFGQDDEMTSLALGLHEKLKKEGVAISSPEYYRRIDETMKKRFPEKFESDKPEAAPSVVVAPATRSTSSKRVRLKASELNIAKKLGISPEQYAKEMLKLEAR